MNTFQEFTNDIPYRILHNELERSKINDQLLYFHLADFTFEKLDYLHGPYLNYENPQKIPLFDQNALFDNCVIVTCRIFDFLKEYKNISKNYFLIVSFTDSDVPHSLCETQFIEMLNSKHLIKCFTVNRSIIHEKLFIIMNTG